MNSSGQYCESDSPLVLLLISSRALVKEVAVELLRALFQILIVLSLILFILIILLILPTLLHVISVTTLLVTAKLLRFLFLLHYSCVTKLICRSEPILVG